MPHVLETHSLTLNIMSKLWVGGTRNREEQSRLSYFYVLLWTCFFYYFDSLILTIFMLLLNYL
jgi:hypothetical protein